MTSDNNGLRRHLLPYDSETYEMFIKTGCKKTTAIEFAHLFGFLKGKNPLSEYVRIKMEDVGLLTPENEIVMENIDQDLDWLLIMHCYEGIMERKKIDGIFNYKLTKKGLRQGEKLIQRLAKQ